MRPVIADRADDLRRLCRQFGVQRLELFGSAATGRYDPQRSDIDFLVEFRPEARARYADAYFGLLEALGALFGRPVDLVVASAITNPYFLESVDRTRIPVHEASDGVALRRQDVTPHGAPA